MAETMRTHTCGQLNVRDCGNDVALCGWVNKYRDLGGLHFIDLRDKYGLIQLSFEDFKGDLKILKECALESTIRVEGKVQSRPDSAVNPNMPTGEIEIAVAGIQVLSRCDIDNIPFLPFAEKQATEDLKLKHRFLDLRTTQLQDILRVRSQMSLRAREFLHSEDFVEIETPVLYKSTPEGARDYIVPSRVHPGKVYALPQSPQTLKQLLMIGGTDKYFQICKCFRDEDLRADRQPEFTQIDIEASFVNADDMKRLAEKLLITVYGLEDDFTLPPMSYREAMDKYGSDKPDLRFGLPHHNVTDLFKDSEFKVFSGPANSGGLVKAMFVPASAGSLARKEIDKLTDVVKPHGGKGVAFFKVAGDAISGGVSKFISPELLSKLQAKTEESEKDGLWVFVADAKIETVHSSSDALRRHLGRALNLIGDGKAFVWIYDFPLLEWDEDDRRFYAKHHPFTQPKNALTEKFLAGKEEDLIGMPAEAYDVVCNGYELGGGSLRIFNQKVQAKMFEVLGFSEEEMRSQFGFFLDALNYGVPPHGGMAFGFDRMVMIKVGTDNIRDVIAFPKTNQASDLMSSSPSAPAKDQLEELHFHWNEKT